jgi:formate dehydrogenase subunit gamma
MSTVRNQIGLDVGALKARDTENVVVGKEIIRHRLSSRVIHWLVADFFFLCAATGLPVFSPVFGWLAGLFGGLAVCRVIHPLAGLAFFASAAAMFLHWHKEMELTRQERGWIGPKLLEYLRDEANHDQIGKYNGGQKVFFFTSALAALGLVLSGVFLWFPSTFPSWMRQIAILVHNVTFTAFFVSIVFHVYLATTAEPGTFNAMTRGTVSKAWARIHHPRWYRELTGNGK